jgi:phosphatidylinositol kinase/protein kinase (PI-3  family)
MRDRVWLLIKCDFMGMPAADEQPIDPSQQATTHAAATRGESLNERALQVVERVSAKLTGRDFARGTTDTLSVAQQVQRLIEQATLHENLCQCYIGWCPFW